VTINVYMTEKQFTLHWCHSARAKKGLEISAGSDITRYGAWLQADLAMLDDAVDDTGLIVLDIDHGREQRIRVRGRRADQEFTAAAAADDFDAMRAAANDLWDVLEEIYVSSPRDADGNNIYDPDGSESNKP